MNPSIQSLGAFFRAVPSPAPLIAFYRDGLGLPVIRRLGQNATFWAGDTATFVVTGGGDAPPPFSDPTEQGSIPVFRCLGIDAVVDRLVRAGGRVLAEGPAPDSVPGRTVYLLDPSGNVTGLREPDPTSTRAQDIESARRREAGLATLEEVGPLPEDVQGLDWIVQSGLAPGPTLRFLDEVMRLDRADPDADAPLVWLGETCLLATLEGRPKDRKQDPRMVTNGFTLRVHSFDDLLTRLLDDGAVQAYAAVKEGTDGKLTAFWDPNGNLLGIRQAASDSERPEDVEARKRWSTRV